MKNSISQEQYRVSEGNNQLVLILNLEQSGCKTADELEAILSETAEGISFVSGKGKHKTEQQREWEALHHLLQQWRKYEEQLQIMGEDRNSYSKTDHDEKSVAASRM